MAWGPCPLLSIHCTFQPLTEVLPYNVRWVTAKQGAVEGSNHWSVVSITAVTAGRGAKPFSVRRAERKPALFRWDYRLFFFVPRFFLEPSKKKWGEKQRARPQGETPSARRAD